MTQQETIKKIYDYFESKHTESDPNEEIDKVWMFRGYIPPEQRTIIEKIEYWLVRHGILTQILWFKWYMTWSHDLIYSIDLDVKDIKFTNLGEQQAIKHGIYPD